MHKTKIPFLFALFIFVSACTSLGVPQPDTFNKKVAAAITMTNTASQTVLTLLKARKITPDESDRYLDRIDSSVKSIAFVQAIHEAEPQAAELRLAVAIKTLELLITELDGRKQ